MKIIFTGGGTGGHFYPNIAVIESLREISEKNKLVDIDMIYMSDYKYDETALFENRVRFIKISAGKVRRYFSLLNVVDFFKTGIGILTTTLKVYSNFPDVIFSKGGYAAFPVVVAAKILGIPLVIHESDSVPGKVNMYAGKFAKKIAISFPSAAKYFPKEKTALIGVPIRKEFLIGAREGARQFLGLEENTPVIFIIGGSQGAQPINDILLDGLEDLVKDYQVIHQCGKNNLKDVKGRSSVILEKSSNKSRYHLFDFLNKDALRMSYSAADLVVSRAGGTSIFEIAISGKPSILIPLENSGQDHQKNNAYDYAAAGACDVLEQTNLTPHLLQSEIKRLLADKPKLEKMSKAALAFARPDAAEKIAQELIRLGIEHK